jgi:hypothetical protein
LGDDLLELSTENFLKIFLGDFLEASTDSFLPKFLLPELSDESLLSRLSGIAIDVLGEFVLGEPVGDILGEDDAEPDGEIFGEVPGESLGDDADFLERFKFKGLKLIMGISPKNLLLLLLLLRVRSGSKISFVSAISKSADPDEVDESSRLSWSGLASMLIDGIESIEFVSGISRLVRSGISELVRIGVSELVRIGVSKFIDNGVPEFADNGVSELVDNGVFPLSMT